MENNKAIPQGYMRIGELAKQAGVTVRTLSYYDKEGLLTPSAQSEGGYRLYTHKDMVKLIQILMLKEMGFPLSEIKKRLTKLDTPEDVRAMLTEQSAHVRHKIAVLTESLKAMESLNEEIAHIQTVNFKQYADIFLNIQMKNEEYRLIKYLDDQVMDTFRERIGREKTALIGATLNDFAKQAAQLIQKDIPPGSEEAQVFAQNFWQVMIDISEGNPQMMLQLSEQFEKAGKTASKGKGQIDEIQRYIKEAFHIYHALDSHVTTPTQTQALMKFASLEAEAFQHCTEGVSPESGKAQKFIQVFWDNITAFTGGNMERLSQLNELTQTLPANEEAKISRRFIEAALEIYLKNHSERDA